MDTTADPQEADPQEADSQEADSQEADQNNYSADSKPQHFINEDPGQTCSGLESEPGQRLGQEHEPNQEKPQEPEHKSETHQEKPQHQDASPFKENEQIQRRTLPNEPSVITSSDSGSKGKKKVAPALIDAKLATELVKSLEKLNKNLIKARKRKHKREPSNVLEKHGRRIASVAGHDRQWQDDFRVAPQRRFSERSSTVVSEEESVTSQMPPNDELLKDLSEESPAALQFKQIKELNRQNIELLKNKHLYKADKPELCNEVVAKLKFGVDGQEVPVIQVHRNPSVLVTANLYSSEECDSILYQAGELDEDCCCIQFFCLTGKANMLAGEPKAWKVDPKLWPGGTERLLAAIDEPIEATSLYVLRLPGGATGYTINPSILNGWGGRVEVFLNDGYAGGETRFVNLGFKITPEKGTSLYWNSTAVEDLFPSTNDQVKYLGLCLVRYESSSTTTTTTTSVDDSMPRQHSTPVISSLKQRDRAPLAASSPPLALQGDDEEELVSKLAELLKLHRLLKQRQKAARAALSVVQEEEEDLL